ncbi:MAG: histidinol-phosphate transaminase [Chthoniobacterales bacterium]
MRSIWDLANPQLRDLAVYQPGKPIEETARELGCRPEEIIKLASNENPLGPSPKAIAAMREALDCAHVYPDGGAFYLREAVAAKIGCARDEIIVGNGSNEIIELLGHAFLSADDEVVTSQHAFVAYKIIAKLFGARTVEAPAIASGHDPEAILAAITPQTQIVFIANPNNPTGTMLGQQEIDAFMARLPEHVVICFDEAYYEYVDDPPDTLKFVREGRNVVVLRTFSKIHGLAGLRVGYGIARAEVIAALQKTREPFNVNSIAQAGACAALDDIEHQRETKRITDDGRMYLQEQFAAMQLPFVPSKGNFVLVNVGDGGRIFHAMLQRRVIVRAMKGYDLAEFIRISIGTMEENERCIATLKEVLAK